MKTPVDLNPTLSFLRELKSNNNKAWFEKNREAYQRAKEGFEVFIDKFIDEFRRVEDFGGLSAKDCTFRINRDIRFSKDKSPYKTNMGAEVARGGRKSGNLGYYFHITPGGESMIAGGVYMPTPEQLAKIRKAIARDANRLKKIINAKEFIHYFGSVEGEKLKTAPSGYAKDHPEIELLKFKQLLAAHRFSDKEVLSPDFLTNTIQAAKALKPFLDYFNSVL